MCICVLIMGSVFVNVLCVQEADTSKLIRNNPFSFLVWIVCTCLCD